MSLKDLSCHHDDRPCYVMSVCHSQFDIDLSASIDTDELKAMFKTLGINLNFIQVLAVMAAADTDKRWVGM